MKDRWWLADGAEAVLGQRAGLSVADWMHAAGAVLSTDRDAAAVRLESAGGPLLLKWRAVPPAKLWRWWLRASRERGEAHGLRLAHARGIDVPAPLAVGERRDALGRLHGAVFVRPFVAGLASAAEALAAPGGERLLAPLARALRTWHDAGWRHGDCWPKNLLVSADGARVLPIGAPKAFVVAAGARADEGRLRDLARFAAGVGFSAPGRDPFTFLDDYLSAPGLPTRARLEPLVRSRLQRVRAKRAEDERTRPLREPHGPPQPVPLPRDAAPVRRERLSGV